MSTSTNLDTKILLKYIAQSLNNWGAHYINQQHFKLAKKNQQSCALPMTRLLFDLSILQIFDYSHTIDDLGIEFSVQDSQQMKDLILAHLYQINCPLLVIQQKENQQQKKVGFDFSSSRLLLITCAWVMGVSNYFNKIVQKLIKAKFASIYKPKPLNLNALSKKGGINLKDINLYQSSTKIDRISFMAKSLKTRKYAIECLVEKKNKILQRFKKILIDCQVPLSIQDVLSSPNNQQIEAKQNELREMILFEKQNMGYRKYWWIWLDQVIILSEYKQLASNFQHFEKVQCPMERIKFNVQIDLDYPKKYLQGCQNYSERFEMMFQKIQQLQIKPKKTYKEIDREIHDEITQMSRKVLQYDSRLPSFIGMQLKRYMQLANKTNLGGQTKPSKQKDKSGKMLRQKIKQFIRDIDQISFI